MATYYPRYHLQPTCPATYAITMTEFSPIVSTVHAPSPVYTPPMPVSILLSTPQAINQVCPYTFVEPVLTSIIPSIIPEIVSVPNAYEPNVCCSPEQILEPSVDIVNEQSNLIEEEQIVTEEMNSKDVEIDPLEFYLTLPKELFPSARMFSVDPNPLIDEFCKLNNISDNAPWILDLEFGIPRVPITRAIPVYDAQFNSIHCKNTPAAIHPGFESCSSDFKRVLLFYYDCIVSTWYKGYIIMNHDKSVKNFQSWLLIPMQIFGMCWP